MSRAEYEAAYQEAHAASRSGSNDAEIECLWRALTLADRLLNPSAQPTNQNGE